MGDSAGITTWTILLFLLVYCVLANYLVYAYANQTYSIPNSSNITCLNCSSNSVFDLNTEPIGFFESLVIVHTDSIESALLTFFLVDLPSLLLFVILAMFFRGVW